MAVLHTPALARGGRGFDLSITVVLDYNTTSELIISWRAITGSGDRYVCMYAHLDAEVFSSLSGLNFSSSPLTHVLERGDCRYRHQGRRAWVHKKHRRSVLGCESSGAKCCTRIKCFFARRCVFGQRKAAKTQNPDLRTPPTQVLSRP